MNKIRFILNYFNHLFTASNTRGHGVHSPFVFNYIQYIIREKNPYYIFLKIENLRDWLLADKREISQTDWGTGKNKSTTVSRIAGRALKNRKCAQLLFRTIHYFEAVNVLELGTSLGITTMYLAGSSNKIKCTSLEGCPAISEIAKENFQKAGIKNIHLITGQIDQTLPLFLSNCEPLDFVFMDANHQYEPTIKYFKSIAEHIHDKSVIVLDDIYWSDEMTKAWSEIKQDSRVTSSIDLFHMGILFFNPNLTKKHYKLKF